MRRVRVRALIEHEGKLLFVQHPHHPDGTWALPGGGVEEGELLADAMKRELVEELGIVPELGSVRYIHQLFLANGNESLEFFFEITNGNQFQKIELDKTTHGEKEIRAVSFINPSQHIVLPEFLANYFIDKTHNIWPKLYVRVADDI
jgi:8-oxo-dGTP pyrophosphatase MutT (NUDIX family)